MWESLPGNVGQTSAQDREANTIGTPKHQNTKKHYTMKSTKKPRLTPAQSKALKAYLFAESQEDRYLGSVFANPIGQRAYEAKTKAAYDACKALGMDYTHGL